MQNRGAWVFAGLGLALVALGMIWMGKALDTKAPIRIERRAPEPVPRPTLEPTLAPEVEAAREEARLRALVTRAAPGLSARAAAQVFPPDEVSRARCSFTGATPVQREGDTAWWNAEFSCVDTGEPEALPNLTSVSVRLRRDGTRWAVED